MRTMVAEQVIRPVVQEMIDEGIIPKPADGFTVSISPGRQSDIIVVDDPWLRKSKQMSEEAREKMLEWWYALERHLLIQHDLSTREQMRMRVLCEIAGLILFAR